MDDLKKEFIEKFCFWSSEKGEKKILCLYQDVWPDTIWQWIKSKLDEKEELIEKFITEWEDAGKRATQFADKCNELSARLKERDAQVVEHLKYAYYLGCEIQKILNKKHSAQDLRNYNIRIDNLISKYTKEVA